MDEPVAETDITETAPSDAFVARASGELDRLRQERSRLVDAEEELRRQRAEVQRSISEIQASLEVYRRTMGLEPDAPVPRELDRAGRRWADLAYDVIARKGGRMRVADLVEELASLRVPGSDAPRAEYATLYSSLKRDARFELVAAGEFEIREASDEEVLREVAQAQLNYPFVGLKLFADRRNWHAKVGDLLDRGFLIKYPVDNPRNPAHPTSAIRVDVEFAEAREKLPPPLLRDLEQLRHQT